MTIGLSLMMLNWMVLDGGGQAACFIGPVPSFAFGSYGTAVCGFVIKAFVGLIDAIALLWLAAIAGRGLFLSQHNPDP